MIKKAIIFVLLLLFLNSVIIPNFASAMGSSNMSDAAVGGIVVGCLVVLGIVYYKNKSSKEPKEDKKENKLTKKKVEERITPSGELVLFRW